MFTLLTLKIQSTKLSTSIGSYIGHLWQQLKMFDRSLNPSFHRKKLLAFNFFYSCVALGYLLTDSQGESVIAVA